MEPEVNWKYAYEKLRREMIDMARRASGEIKENRRQIAMLGPKGDAWDTLRHVLSMMPRRSEVMSEDVAAMLDKRVTELLNETKDS